MQKNSSYIPNKRDRVISLALPSSLVKDTPHLREKVYKIGMIGRAASIFRIEEVIIYIDRFFPGQYKEARLIRLILEYMETPQYLRKDIFKIIPQLQYAGILPPLRTPNHLVPDTIEKIHTGDFRDGVVINSNDKISLVNVGLKKLAKVKYYLKEGSRVTVRINNINDEIWACPINREEIRIYWGYRVIFPKISLGEVIRRMEYDLIIATSKYGRKVSECLKDIRDKWEKAQKILIMFGSPTHGVDELLAKESIITEDISDFKINMIPNQGVETVRTEEAVNASLSILNLFD